MSRYTRIASVTELPREGEAREFPFGSRMICIANNGGHFSALNGVCPHKGGPLAEGVVEDGKLVCPWHGWEFHLSSGACANHSGFSVEVFELEIQGEEVFLKS